jgi:hypothetical protein
VPFLTAEAAQGRHALEQRERGGVEFHLEKSWHAVHFCLTGNGGKTSDPRGMIRADGRTLGSAEFGLGPPWGVLPSEVASFASVIAVVSVKDFFIRYEPAAIRSEYVYGAGSLTETPESFDYVWWYFLGLRDFVTAAAAHGDGLIGWMT